ncbi:tetraspanin-33-like [Dermacentor albipictus]|uniref:tetraspanin-33-like n=1 Tax=Dermacentor albipictus TaxID=60249 RepID=UPI0031FD802C
MPKTPNLSPLMTSTPPSPASRPSPKRRGSSEISSTTVYDVSAIYVVPLCASNFFLMIGSSVVFLSSLYATFDPNDSDTPSSTEPSTWLAGLLFHLETVLMVSSGLLFLAASVGLLGVVRENLFLLKVYGYAMLFLVALGLGASMLAAGIPWLAQSFVTDYVTEDFVVHYRDKADYKNTIDYLQTSLDCCGMSQAGYRDWQANAYFACNKTNPSAERCSVPPSCCRRTPDYGLIVQDAPKHSAHPTVPSTLCGRGVLRMAERDAWKDCVSWPAVYAARVRTLPEER